MSILVGSRAAKYHFPDFYREPQDYDYWTLEGPENDKRKLPLYNITQYSSTQVGYVYHEFHNVSHLNGCKRVVEKGDPNPKTLYTIKVSHSFWNINWGKTIGDILFFQSKGVEFDEDLYRDLYKDWELVHGKKPAYLNQDKEVFFTDGVKRKYVHDDIHDAISYYDEPMYAKLTKDPNKPLLSKKLFDQLSHEDKIKLCREEIMVTALERHLIPTNFNYSRSLAYLQAAKSLIVSGAKGWFPLFIILNWTELRKSDIDYVRKFKEKEHLCTKL